MSNNDVLKSLRYILNVSDKKITEIVALSGLKISVQDVERFLIPDDHPDYLQCDDEAMAHFLDGLIFFQRGKDDSKPRLAFELPISNNLVLKKLRVAFKLQEDDMHAILEKANFPVGRSELSAFLRKKDHINYRPCGDQVLRYFLKGLSLRNL